MSGDMPTDEASQIQVCFVSFKKHEDLDSPLKVYLGNAEKSCHMAAAQWPLCFNLQSSKGMRGSLYYAVCT